MKRTVIGLSQYLHKWHKSHRAGLVSTYTSVTIKQKNRTRLVLTQGGQSRGRHGAPLLVSPHLKRHKIHGIISDAVRLPLLPFLQSLCPIHSEDAPLVKRMYLAFSSVPGESCHRWSGSLLCSCNIFWQLTNSVCWLHPMVKRKTVSDNEIFLFLFFNTNRTFQLNCDVLLSTSSHAEFSDIIKRTPAYQSSR